MDDYNRRLQNFLDTDNKITEFKLNNMKPNFTIDHNYFSDYDETDFSKILGFKAVEGFERPVVTLEETEGFGVNWVTNGAVSAVLD